MQTSKQSNKWGFLVFGGGSELLNACSVSHTLLKLKWTTAVKNKIQRVSLVITCCSSFLKKKLAAKQINETSLWFSANLPTLASRIIFILCVYFKFSFSFFLYQWHSQTLVFGVTRVGQINSVWGWEWREFAFQ